LEIIPFEAIRMDCSKGRKAGRLGGVRQGSSGVPGDLVLSETAGARDEILKFLQRLNRMACIDG